MNRARGGRRPNAVRLKRTSEHRGSVLDHRTKRLEEPEVKRRTFRPGGRKKRWWWSAKGERKREREGRNGINTKRPRGDRRSATAGASGGGGIYAIRRDPRWKRNREGRERCWNGSRKDKLGRRGESEFWVAYQHLVPRSGGRLGGYRLPSSRGSRQMSSGRAPRQGLHPWKGQLRGVAVVESTPRNAHRRPSRRFLAADASRQPTGQPARPGSTASHNGSVETRVYQRRTQGTRLSTSFRRRSSFRRASCLSSPRLFVALATLTSPWPRGSRLGFLLVPTVRRLVRVAVPFDLHTLSTFELGSRGHLGPRRGAKVRVRWIMDVSRGVQGGTTGQWCLGTSVRTIPPRLVLGSAVGPSNELAARVDRFSVRIPLEQVVSRSRWEINTKLIVATRHELGWTVSVGKIRFTGEEYG